MTLTFDKNSKTCDQFWDCNCNEYFVHRKEDGHCVKCDCYHYEMPDSQIADIYNQRDRLSLTLEEKSDLLDAIMRFWNIKLS